MESILVPQIYDTGMVTQELSELVLRDSSISSKQKNLLLGKYPCKSNADEGLFIADVLVYGMERAFVKRDAKTKEQLHVLLEKDDKVFLRGIAGIGKSELAKADAAIHEQRDEINTPAIYREYERQHSQRQEKHTSENMILI